jgi:hypothetical protein
MAHETRASSLLQDFDRRLVDGLPTYRGIIRCNTRYEEYDETGGVAGVRAGAIYGKFDEVDCRLAPKYCKNNCNGHALIWWLRSDSTSFGAIWRNDPAHIMVFEGTEIGLKTLLSYPWHPMINKEDPDTIDALTYWVYTKDFEVERTVFATKVMAQLYGREDWDIAWIMPKGLNALDVRRENLIFVRTIEVKPEDVHSRIKLHTKNGRKYWRATINHQSYTRAWHPLERESRAYKELYDIVEGFLDTEVYT